MGRKRNVWNRKQNSKITIKQQYKIQQRVPTQNLCYLAELTWVFQFLLKLGSADMAGEIGVIFNIPQPFTVRTRRLSQVIRISHHDFKQMVQQHGEDGTTIINNFIQVWKIMICSILTCNQKCSFLKKLKEIRYHKRSSREKLLLTGKCPDGD